MKPHLSSHQIAQWIAGEKTPSMEGHLAGCLACAAEVERVAGPLALFRTSVRALAEQQMGPVRFVAPVESRWRLTVPLRWRITLATAAAMAVAAIPVSRHFRPVEHPAVAIATPHVSDEALLRQVESEISRSVPATMEPLANLMSNNYNQSGSAQAAGTGRAE